MTVDPALLALATAWRPQRPGTRRPRDIRDALVEPEWEGLRVIVAVEPGAAVLVHEGEPVATLEELPRAIVDAFSATGALVEGRLTTRAFQATEGVSHPDTPVERPSLLIPKSMKGSKDDPFVRARDHERLAVIDAGRTQDELASGTRHAFVAVDLLWIDGTPLDDIPLLERKRLLGSCLDETFLVRVSPYVGETAYGTHVTWGSMGFRSLHYRAANSRYRPGEANPDCAVAQPPKDLTAARGRR